ncbi:universal stress protein [Sulfitobacter sp. M57]|uniref:universal stress protein n=1 Tax=unclassified Sulfitobacter TaxID=196795 RepID=UPI0023E32771|nr:MULTISPECIES: universal stress protein [unclassified Sulfitobacter]MDF3413375.1 universal stress protein [Sulfitobacter sp. KE5]MDF3421345.1 universal stress protein [Sulfitobacter sp. KE43]MDF3431922.1 universal stress protein [Sulfitobacter sp. KE42]MDF3457562.1 universal stress protein [Sulfitobacter sp. S74]MDF3461464.1 universal stress protein [Sulfitobacter sp. Ks18]
MSIQTVTTILTDIDQAPAQLEAAIGTARALDAHLHVLALASGLVDQAAMMGAALDPIPVSLGVEDSLARAKELGELATTQLSAEDIRWHVETAVGSGASNATEIARHTRFSDLVVQHRLSGPADQDRTRRLAETVLFESGVPLLLLPDATQIAAPPSKVLVSWDESDTALRAVRQAMPLLTKATYVHVVMVDPPKDAPDRSDPGGALAQYLSRQGIKCELSVCNQNDGSISSTLERRATELGCGMIVMGAYGHSRLREAIFGGTTRNILANATLPVFMAH